MKNNFFKTVLIFLFLLNSNLFAKNLEINSSEVKLDKKDSKIVFKGNIKAVDENKNTLMADEAHYNKKDDLLNSIGATTIITSENYRFESSNVTFDNKNKIIKSDFPTKILDKDGNEIMVNMFNYNSIKNILFSKGDIQLKDKKKNLYKFNQIYIDEKKKKVIGSDAKIYFNDDSMKIDKRNNQEFLQIVFLLRKELLLFKKGFLHIVNLERTISVHHGN